MGANFRQPPNAGAEAVIVSKNITANGTYNASSDSADGYNPVTVNVPESVIKSKLITANGTYNASADNADGFNPITVLVPEKVIIGKNITANGTYLASNDSADGYNPVAVEVPQDKQIAKYANFAYCYITTDGTLYYKNEQNNFINLWEVPAGQYLVCPGSTISNRSRCCYKEGATYSDFITYLTTPGPAIAEPVLYFTGGEYHDSELTSRIILTLNNPGVIAFSTGNYTGVNAIGYCFKLS